MPLAKSSSSTSPKRCTSSSARSCGAQPWRSWRARKILRKRHWVSQSSREGAANRLTRQSFLLARRHQASVSQGALAFACASGPVERDHSLGVPAWTGDRAVSTARDRNTVSSPFSGPLISFCEPPHIAERAMGVPQFAGSRSRVALLSPHRRLPALVVKPDSPSPAPRRGDRSCRSGLIAEASGERKACADYMLQHRGRT